MTDSPKPGRFFSAEAVTSPSLISERGLDGNEAIAELASFFQGDYFTAAISTILFCLLAFQPHQSYPGLYRYSPLKPLRRRTVLWSLSGFCDMSWLQVLKANEYAFQHRPVPPAEQRMPLNRLIELICRIRQTLFCQGPTMRARLLPERIPVGEGSPRHLGVPPI